MRSITDASRSVRSKYAAILKSEGLKKSVKRTKPSPLKTISEKSEIEDQIGTGFVSYNPKDIEYVYWRDPNKLIDRLMLLLASRSSGNTSHESEIAAIEAALREADIIE